MSSQEEENRRGFFEVKDNNKVKVDILSNARQKKINEYKRFFILCIGCFGCLCTSFSYAYNLISGYFQEQLHLKQKDLVNISVVGECVSCFVLPYAFLYDYAGPLPISILCTLLFCLGTLLIAFASSDYIEPSIVRIAVFYAIMKSGCLLFDLANVVTVVSHFPTLRGPIIALLKSYIGIGSAIVGAIQLAFFDGSLPWLMYFLCIYAFCVGVAQLIVMHLPKYHLTGYQQSHLSVEEAEKRKAGKSQYLRQKPPMWRVVLAFVILIVLVIFLPTQSALVNYKDLVMRYKKGFAIAAIVVTLSLVLIFVPTPLEFLRKSREAESEPTEEEQEWKEEKNDVNEDPFEVEDTAEAADGGKLETEVDFIAPQYQESFLRNLLTLRLWSILWTLFCLTGAEFVVISNSSYVFGAIAKKPTDKNLRTLLTTLNGAGSAVGRLGMAAFEYLTQHRPPEKRVLITWSPYVPTILMILAMVFFICLPTAALPFPYVLTALANGSQAAQTVILMRTIYAKDVAKHYNFCYLGNVTSNIILVRFLYAEWYTKQAQKELTNGYCYGRNRCLMMPLCVLLGLVVSSLFSTTYLHLKYKAFSKRVLAERRRVMEGQLEERCVEPAAEDETKPVQEPLVGVLYTEEPEEDRPRNATQ